MTDDDYDTDDVAEVLDTIDRRTDVRADREMLDHISLRFDADVDPGLGSDTFTFEVDLSSGNMWLHKRTDDGNETVWKQKRLR
jgi:hypothetical protein